MSQIVRTLQEINSYLKYMSDCPDLYIVLVNHIQIFKETGDSRYIYQNKLHKACFQHEMAYGDFKDITRTTVSDKILHHKAFNIAKSPKTNGYQGDLASMVYKFF